VAEWESAGRHSRSRSHPVSLSQGRSRRRISLAASSVGWAGSVLRSLRPVGAHRGGAAVLADRISAFSGTRDVDCRRTAPDRGGNSGDRFAGGSVRSVAELTKP
jgi:hypothetical protein